jgi:hypothetical protein
MTALMLDMMVLMMPWMKPILYIGLAASAAGIILVFAGATLARDTRLNGLLWSGRVAVGLGLFFFACEGMGKILGAAPQFNLGDSSKFEFWMVPFWQAGALLLVCGLVIGNILSRQRSQIA